MLVFAIVQLTLTRYMVDAPGRIEVNLMRYKNEGGKDENGNCCESYFPFVCPKDTCDPVFSLCVDPADSEAENCAFGSHTTDALFDVNAITFGTAGADLINVVFNISGAVPQLITLVVHINDEDDGRNDIIGKLEFTLEISKGSTVNKRGTEGKTSLDISVSAACDQNYYGDCSKFCLPDYPYTCDINGDKVCSSGVVCNAEMTTTDFIPTTQLQPLEEPCANHSCQNGATCIAGTASNCGTDPMCNLQNLNYFCICSADFTGFYCDTAGGTTHDTPPGRITKGTTLDGTNMGTTFDGTNKRTTLKGITRDTKFDGTTMETTFDGTTMETTLDGTTKDTALDGTTKDTALDGTTKDTALDGTTKDTALDGTTKDTALDGTTKGGTSPSPEVDFENCSEHTRKDGSTCICNSSNFTYICSRNVTGQCYNKTKFIRQMADADQCYQHQCIDGGTCLEVRLGYNCECPPGIMMCFCNISAVTETPPSLDDKQTTVFGTQRENDQLANDSSDNLLGSESTGKGSESTGTELKNKEEEHAEYYVAVVGACFLIGLPAYLLYKYKTNRISPGSPMKNDGDIERRDMRRMARNLSERSKRVGKEREKSDASTISMMTIGLYSQLKIITVVPVAETFTLFPNSISYDRKSTPPSRDSIPNTYVEISDRLQYVRRSSV